MFSERCADLDKDKQYKQLPRTLQAVEDVNADQMLSILKKIVAKYGEDLSGYPFVAWGLAFKPDTDALRRQIHAYDPKAEKEAKTCYLKENDRIEYFDGKHDALKGCDTLIRITEWKELRSPNFERMLECIKTPVIFERRNQYNAAEMKKLRIEYSQIGAGGGTLEWEE